jgi:hypothetical protein
LYGLGSLGLVGTVTLVAAWLFVLSPIVHAFIHLGSNYVPNRRRATYGRER